MLKARGASRGRAMGIRRLLMGQGPGMTTQLLSHKVGWRSCDKSDDGVMLLMLVLVLAKILLY